MDPGGGDGVLREDKERLSFPADLLKVHSVSCVLSNHRIHRFQPVSIFLSAWAGSVFYVNGETFPPLINVIVI